MNKLSYQTPLVWVFFSATNYIMKTITLYLISFFACLVSFSQMQNVKEEEKHQQSQIFGEVSGPGVGLSVNYEKIYWKGKDGFAFCAGVGLCPFISTAAIT